MDDAKNRMYNYETPPPDGVWEAIAAELDRNEAKVIPIRSKKKNNTFYYIAAASVAVILFGVIFFTNKPSKSNQQFVTTSDKIKNDSSSANNDSTNSTVMMTVPTEEKPSIKNDIDPDNSLAENKSDKGGPNKKQTKEEIKRSGSSGDELIANNSPSKYITIEGPQGQPVKVSSKMALLIDSSETKNASKPIWNKKINEWREIMKGNTVAPTPGNFLDIVELTKTLKDHK